MILLRILNCMDVSQATILENEYFQVGTLLSPAFFISPSNADGEPAIVFQIEPYPYLLFSPLFSKASALFSRRAKQSLFCLVIVTTGKMVQNG